MLMLLLLGIALKGCGGGSEGSSGSKRNGSSRSQLEAEGVSWYHLLLGVIVLLLCSAGYESDNKELQSRVESSRMQAAEEWECWRVHVERLLADHDRGSSSIISLDHPTATQSGLHGLRKRQGYTRR